MGLRWFGYHPNSRHSAPSDYLAHAQFTRGARTGVWHFIGTRWSERRETTIKRAESAKQDQPVWSQALYQKHLADRACSAGCHKGCHTGHHEGEGVLESLHEERHIGQNVVSELILGQNCPCSARLDAVGDDGVGDRLRGDHLEVDLAGRLDRKTPEGSGGDWTEECGFRSLDSRCNHCTPGLVQGEQREQDERGLDNHPTVEDKTGAHNAVVEAPNAAQEAAGRTRA